jgi:CHAT domain-containing protein
VVAIRIHDVVLLLFLYLLSGCGRSRHQTVGADYETTQRLLKEGKLQQALVGSEAGLQGCGSSGESCWRFRLLKAEALLLMGRAKAALSLLEVADSPPQSDLQARRLMHQGQAWYRLSDFSRAEGFLREARQLASTSGAPLLVAEVELRQAALLFGRADRFDDAVASLRRVIEAAIQGGDPYLQANAMGNLGYLFLGRFRYEEAIYWLQRAYDLFERIDASNSAAKTIGNLGWCYFRLGDSERALADFSAAQERFASAGDHRSEQIWLGNSGSVFWEAGDFAAATIRYSRALTVARGLDDKSWTAKWLTNLAVVAIESEQLDAAERYNDEALAINRNLRDTNEERYNQVTSARIAGRQKQPRRAEELFRSVVKSASEDPTPTIEAQAGLADLYVQTGDATMAEAQFRSAITTIESRQAGLTKDDYKLSYLSSLVRFYQSYVDFLVQRGAVERALEVVESSRARILTERVKTRVAVPQRLCAADLQALARSSHRILLSYWLAPKQSYVWVITPAKIKLLTLPPEKEIRGLVESYRTAIEDRRDPIDSHLPAGERLSAMLLGPLSELVPPGSRVVVVPDGALHSLDFDTLPSPRDPSKYWIEDVVLSVAPSLGLMLNSRTSMKPAHLSLLAMGDPESPGQEYPRLPNARKEVETIAALFSAPNRVVYEGQALHPSVYRQADPARFSLIHFAAHATANRASPLDSALILSREGNSYALSARDIMNIPLDADLVTLSSCRSAGAKAYSGEGLVGLTWAFQQAGARRVIAGLWDVDDESTSVLMAKLYRELARGVPAEEALREAKLTLLHSAYPYRKPYYWGPFQLYSGM